jgi:hyperosmotically inducible periplasmic protein
VTNKWKSFGVSLAVVTLSLGPAYSAKAQQPSPDNTKVNKRDQQPSQKTADQQKNNASDLETTRQIRKVITADDSLSTDAHNVKIITIDGKVTLKGPVRTPAEKAAVFSKAVEIAGAKNVTNQISIKATENSGPVRTQSKKTKGGL